MNRVDRSAPENTLVDTLRRGELCSVPYHVESHGPGRSYYSWGDPVVGEARGPEGWLRVRLDGDDIVLDIDGGEAPLELDGRSCPGGTVLSDTEVAS